MSDPLDQLSNHLKAALTRALCFVLERGGSEILPVHLLWAVATQEQSVAARTWREHAKQPEALERVAADFACPNDGIVTSSPALSEHARFVLEKAILASTARQHEHVGTEHVLAQLFELTTPDISKALQECGVTPENTKKTAVPAGAEPCPDCGEVHKDDEHTSPLQYFTKELTAAEHLRTLDPVIGRDAEIARVAAILGRKHKHNAVLIGEPGVGKTAIVEGLAKMIADGSAPPALHGHRIFALEMASLVAGATYRGDFEARVLDLLEEVQSVPGAILFIDELHTVVGAGSASGSLDAANILKPALARGQVKVIGATTLSEYKKHIEPDGALARRFLPVVIQAPGAEEAVQMVMGVRESYARHHGLHITDDAVVAAVQLADTLYPHRSFPDKALDIFDEAAARQGGTARRALLQAEQQLAHKSLERERAALAALPAEQHTERVAAQERIASLEIAVSDAEERLARRTGILTADHIAATAEALSGVPLQELTGADTTALTTLEERLRQHVFGQDSTVATVSHALRRARLRLHHPHRPMASFLFLGPSGVGKTELAKAIAQEYFGDSSALLRFDMSEFAEPHAVSKLIGSPPGYVGYREAARLTDGLKKRPYTVLLFDEIEKAHRDIHHLLLQLLDEGVIEDASGTRLDARQTVIILTSNLGRSLATSGSLGFAPSRTLSDRLRGLLEEHFAPEFVARLDHLCLFAPLSQETLLAILRRELHALQERTARHHGRTVNVHATVLRTLLPHIHAKRGARDIRRVVQEYLEPVLVNELLRPTKKSSVTLTVKNGTITAK